MSEPQLSPHKVYLGDSVYADFDGWHIVLTIENGYGASNRIALDPQVLDALDRYRESLQPKQQQDSEK